jgi:hypothetical protein
MEHATPPLKYDESVARTLQGQMNKNYDAATKEFTPIADGDIPDECMDNTY